MLAQEVSFVELLGTVGLLIVGLTLLLLAVYWFLLRSDRWNFRSSQKKPPAQDDQQDKGEEWSKPRPFSKKRE